MVQARRSELAGYVSWACCLSENDWLAEGFNLAEGTLIVFGQDIPQDMCSIAAAAGVDQDQRDFLGRSASNGFSAIQLERKTGRSLGPDTCM